MPLPVLAEEPNFAAFIAIDWADRQHVWVLQVAGSSQRETGRLEQIRRKPLKLGPCNARAVFPDGLWPWPWSRRVARCCML